MSQARRAEQVAAAVRDIRAFHALGRKIPPKRSPKEAYDRGELRAAAARLGVSAELARQARQVAGAYTRVDLDELCSLIRAVQPGQDAAKAVFGRTHLVRLMTVPKTRREKFQRTAVEKGWSTHVLDERIAAAFGTRRAGGRKRRLPGDAVGLLVAAEKLCEQWRRWLRLVDPATGESGHATLAALPDDLRRQVEAAGRGVRKLHLAITDELRRRRPQREVRPAFREQLGEAAGARR